ncbi:hypothetical protein BCR44DRAFT_1444710 [Catenaria anguillulae PL171]|uniref:Helix-turn-helix domain-containing protein n=1 Tax=Catenaria anguillulae PL171 TaxID=765915 RepID=A0A1Y2H979_9FUNG|nr:hypothetical protein BCR44DRAFT_1444710 [Catenaria anguillulae PL171]
MTDDIQAAVKGHAHPNTIFHALYAYFFLHLSMAVLARIFCKSRSTLSGWISRYENSGLVGCSRANNRAKKFSHDQRLWLYNYFMIHPVSYLHEARKGSFH